MESTQSQPPTLRGKRVTLEPLAPNMAEDLATAILPGDDVFRWTNTAPRSPDEMRAWIVARQTARAGLRNEAFSQRDAATGRLVGSTSLFDIDTAQQSAEIGHTWLAASARRSGINTEAKLLLLTRCFETLGLKRVQLCTDLRNTRSQDAIARLGAVREGVLRNWRRNLEGGLRTTVVYSIIDAEWPAVRQRFGELLR